MDGIVKYIDVNKEQELMKRPELGWMWFDGVQLTSKSLEPSKAKVSTLVTYSESALMVLLKSDQKEIVHRDRSYQNGDGFHFVLAHPREDSEKTREFYVIGISPLSDGWQSKFIWYKNVDLAMTVLENTKVVYKPHNGEHHFLVRIPWSEIEPFKGYLTNQFGFNISYVQNLSDHKIFHMLKEDDRIQSEQSPRAYSIYSFEKPSIPENMEVNWRVNKKHCNIGEDISLDLCLNSPVADLVDIRISTGERLLVEESYILNEGCTIKELLISTRNLSQGKYKLEFHLKGKSVERCDLFEIFVYSHHVLNTFGEAVHDDRLLQKDDLLQVESMASLKFYDKKLKESLYKLRPYESFDKIDSYFNKISDDFQKVKDGKHLFERGRFIQYGHESDIDQSLEPYSLYLPQSIEDITQASLLVYLHGSGSDDTSIRNNSLMKELAEDHQMILLAPFGRGTSNFYCSHESMEDVVELTKKVCQMFSINQDKVLLSGFSMGGYGVYRVFDYAPELYKGLIIMSGHHSIGQAYGGPDYMTKMDTFAEIPIIIFHGARDLNCDYEEHKSFIDSLSPINHKCQVYVKTDAGHCGLIKEWYQPLSNWLELYFDDINR